MASRAGKVALFVLAQIARALWVSTMVLTPLFGFWLASSLAAYHNATQWLALLVGLLLFPILPLGWDLLFVWRRKRKEKASDKKPGAAAKPAILTRLDRLVLRTLIINGLFLGGMMWQARDSAFRALAVRGDWMLDGHHGRIASTLRDWMLGLADRLDRRTQPDNHYGESDKAPDDVKPPDDPLPTRIVDNTTPDSDPDVEPPKDPKTWPLPRDFHPLVAEIPEGDQATIESVGAYFSSRITDKRDLTKALHDYVVNRLHYDYDALKYIDARDWKNTPPQDAEAVFARKAGVCEGYARLMTALGKAAGIEIAYVTGYIRDSQRRLVVGDDPTDASTQQALEGVGHAWNAVKLDDGWYLMDATWDDPTKGEHNTTYLFIPPQLMAYDHFPEDPKWQLLANPLTLGDFVRQPLLDPRMGEMGLGLISPTRSQVTVDGSISIVLDNPYGAEVTAVAVIDGSPRETEGTRCTDTTAAKRTTITCPLGDGEYEIKMFATPRSHAKTGKYTLDYVGSILANSH